MIHSPPAKRTVALRTVDSEGKLGHTVVVRPDRAIKLAAVMANLCPFLVPFLGKQKSTRNGQMNIESNY
ncbi:hypothetical protein COR50_03695 [Chitinophaga caeni]|uniref:Uncharacterized protein n=1 Tax=Chitinophaga caeni TaxID=2029983 RepID=A0A291QQS5_9BACT|nr:hypothetical protein COR50_03695 [Chitinophaga caeni]